MVLALVRAVDVVRPTALEDDTAVLAEGDPGSLAGLLQEAIV